MPVLLLNKERVANEILVLARLKIMGLLGVPSQAVTARWELKDGKAVPAFDVDLAHVKNLSEDAVRQSMGAAWRWVKDLLAERLAGLGERRR